jgi:GalNAc-alpha-(1->4)-GalNAc-alpha-(1->3)-diNAcBac-PP-undecaprenol alpha-1,4-N-acetyl-D-galactosaminyltransferase
MKATKKIALYFRSIKSSGGAERKVCELANQFKANGFDVHVLCLDQEGTPSFYDLHKDIVLHYIPAGNSHHSVLSKVKKTYKLYKILKSNSIKALIGFVMSGDKTLYVASILSRTKIIVCERNSPKMYQYKGGAYYRCGIYFWMLFSKKIIVQNPIYIKSYPKILIEKIISIENSVEIPKKISSPADPSLDARYRILAVQRVDYFQKRPDLLINSFAKIAAKAANWDLYIVGGGDGKSIQRLKDEINNLGIERRVFLIPESKIINYHYLNSNLFATTTLWEGFPNALAEALSYGLPAVVYEGVLGVSDFVGAAGWLAKGNDSIDSFSNSLLEAIRSDMERERRGLIGRKMMEKYSPEQSLKKWSHLMQSLE